MDYKTWSLDQWVEMFEGIYGAANKNRSDEHILLRVLESVALLGENIRKGQLQKQQEDDGSYTGIVVNLAKTFAWFNALSSRYGSLDDMLWEKYPGRCSSCLVENECSCLDAPYTGNKDEKMRVLETARDDTEKRPVTVYDWQRLFHKLYGKANADQTLEQIGYHLVEEVGEVARALRHGNKVNLREEMADVVAWSFAVVIKSGEMVGSELRLDEILWDRYPNQCSYCASNPCQGEYIDRRNGAD